jgi:hypothetical protein
MLDNLPSDMQDKIRQNFNQTSFQHAAEMAVRGSPGMGGGFAPQPTPDILAAATAASKKYGIPLAAMLAISGAESRHDMSATSSSGAKGAWQVIDSTARRYGYSPQDMRDPVKNADAAAQEFKMDLEASGGDYSQAMAAYNMGAGRMADIKAGRLTSGAASDVARFNNYNRQYQQMPMTELNRNADQQASDLNAGKYVFDAHNTVVTGFSDAVSAVSFAATKTADGISALGTAAENAAKALGRIGGNIGNGMGGPKDQGGAWFDGIWVPNSQSKPNQQQTPVR